MRPFDPERRWNAARPVQLIGPVGRPVLADSVGFGSIKVAPIELTAGTHTFEVMDNTDGGLIGTFAVDVESGDVALILRGFVDPSANQNGSAVNLQAITVSSLTLVALDEEPATSSVALHSNYPNPFNTSTTFSYEVDEHTRVTLTMYDLLGRRRAVLVDEMQGSGSFAVPFHRGRVASGVYIYRLEAGDVRLTRSMVIVR